MEGKTDLDFFPKEFADAWLAEEQELFKTGKPVVNNLCTNRLKDGVRTRLVSTFPIKDDRGQVVRLVGIAKDITDLVDAMDRLRFHSGLLEKVIDTIPQFVFVKDTLGRYVLCNKHFAERHGYTDAKQIFGKTDFDHWSRDQGERYRKMDQKVIDEKTPQLHFVEEQHWKDGRKSIVVTSKIPLMDDNGKVIAVLGIYDDITGPFEKFEKGERDCQGVVASVRKSMDQSSGSLCGAWHGSSR